MSNPFDELTLGEVEVMSTICLDGKSFEDSSPFALAGGVMFMHRRRQFPDIDWDEFKNTTNMGDIKAFSELMNDDEELNPTNGAMPITA
jgi:hypothetical protein